jgi:hypothetical protein
MAIAHQAMGKAGFQLGQLLGWGGHRAKSTGLHKPASITEAGQGLKAKDRQLAVRA